MAKLFGVPVRGGAAPDLPDKATRTQMMELAERFLETINRDVARATATLSGMSPNFWALVQPWPFPDYLTYDGALIGLFVPRKNFLVASCERFVRRRSARVQAVLRFVGGRSDCGDCCKNCKRTV